MASSALSNSPRHRQPRPPDMIGRIPSAARDLFATRYADGSGPAGFLSRFQQSVHYGLQQLATTTTTTLVPSPRSHHHTSMTAPPVTASCSLNSTFVCASHEPSDPILAHVVAKRGASATSNQSPETEYILTALDGISIQIAQYLDGTSLGRLQLVNRSWQAFVREHREELFARLLATSFETVITSSSHFKSYLFSLRHELDQELAHNRYILNTHSMLEEYCTTMEPENHGFVAMFCDIIRFKDPRIARFVAHRRQSALSMVLASTPEHVQAFRRRCKKAGPITFVPIDNPNWPQFDLPQVEFPGFLGYAFEHVEVVKGYESLKHTVIKSILKELMIFDTQENADAYSRATNQRPFVAILGAEMSNPNYHMTFSNPLREEMRHLPVKDRVQILLKRIDAIDHSISHTTSA